MNESAKNLSKKFYSSPNRLYLTAFIVVITGLFFLGGYTTGDEDSSKDVSKEITNYTVSPVHIPETLNFAGEKVPLENFDTRESLDRELLVNTYWHSSTMMLIKRASRYLPDIEPILAKYKVPDDFKYLAIAESSLTQAVSPAGAVGFWQFLEGTAKDYGLEVNSMVDERYHIEKSTEAACKYLLESYEKFGSWTLVAASYNMGRNNIRKQIVTQKETNYYDLLLGEETERYVFRLLALKMILSAPGKYGFIIDDHELYPYINTYKVEIDSSVNSFADFAHYFNVNYKILKYFNPWLRKPYLNNPYGKTYSIQLPQDGVREYSKELDTLLFERLR